MSRTPRIVGLVFVIAALPLTLRLIWEMTWLTWHDGPQMVGFSLAHMFPGFLIFGFAAMLFVAMWVLLAIVTCLRERRFWWPDILLISISLMLCGAPFIPQSIWSSVTELVLGMSPQANNLMVTAAGGGLLARVRYLLKRGVPADVWDDQGCSAIAAAAGSKSPETVRLLLDHHANPNSSCADSPAVLRAIEKNDVTSLKLLLAAGADVKARDKQGFTAYDQALFSKNEEIIQYLQSKGVTE